MCNELLSKINMKQKQIVTYNLYFQPIYCVVSSLCHWTLQQSKYYVAEKHEINVNQNKLVTYNHNLFLVCLSVSSL